jgi:hypothetical protein
MWIKIGIKIRIKIRIKKGTKMATKMRTKIATIKIYAIKILKKQPHFSPGTFFGKRFAKINYITSKFAITF